MKTAAPFAHDEGTQGRTASASTLYLGRRIDSDPPPSVDLTASVQFAQWRRSDNTAAWVAGPHHNLFVVDARAWPTHPGGFDSIVASDFDADLHPLACLDAFDATLAPAGVVWLKSARKHFDWGPFGTLAHRAGWILEPPPSPAGWAHLVRRDPPPRWRIAHASPENYREIAALFATVFGHALTEPLWQWKYGAGRGNAVLARRDGRLVAHYGGMYRDVLHNGAAERVAQIGDVMVDANERGVLTRQGPFALVGMSWPEIYGPKGFGFPTDRALRVAEKLGVYVQAGRMVSLSWSAGPSGPRWASRVRQVVPESPVHRASVEFLWQAMREHFFDGVIGVRDWAYVRHRYLEHPANRYELVLVDSRWRRRPLGLLVFRKHNTHLEWLDFVGSLGELPVLVDQARRLTGRWGLPKLVFWCTAQHARRFTALGAEAHALDLAIPASCWPDPENPQRYIGKWWLTAGDTDFR